MDLRIDIEQTQEHLVCEVDGDFTPENALTVLNKILSVCAMGDNRAVLIDITAVKKGAAASVKVIAGMEARETLNKFAGSYGAVPKIAVLGQAPLITSYRPAEDFLQSHDLPFAVFTDRARAFNWLTP